MILKKYISGILPTNVKHLLKRILNLDRKFGYSQFGEDYYLFSYFSGLDWSIENRSPGLPDEGFYVDIGAYSPTECSNTYLFYLNGWRGINVDAAPGSTKLFNLTRPRDININKAISDVDGTITFYSWGTPNVFNTTSYTLAQERERLLNDKPSLYTVECKTLEWILDNYLPKNTRIDFLNIDVEGADLKVIKSNNWSKYRPRIVVSESYVDHVEELIESELYNYMINNGYLLYAWIRPSIIFINTQG